MTEDTEEFTRMSDDDLIEMMVRTKEVWERADLDPSNRMTVLVLLTANFVLVLNELWYGGDRDKAHQFAANIHKNVIRQLDHLLDMNLGIHIDGIGPGHA